MKSLLAVLILLAAVGAWSDESKLQITEVLVPWENTRPRDPDVAPDGNIWLVGQAGDYIARYDTDSGEFSRFDLPGGAGPHNLIVAPDGSIWYAGNRQGYIGHMDQHTGKVKKIPMPDPATRDPHTLVFDHKGNIWFTAQNANVVGRLNMETEKVDIVHVPTAKARPYGIKLDPDGRPWVVLVGSYKLFTVDPETLVGMEIELPRSDARPRRVELTSDGRVWYVDYAKGYLGVYDPSDGKFTEWRTPGGEKSGPYGMAVDGQDRLWFVETWQNPNRFVGFDPKTGEFFSSALIESGGGSVRHMVFDSKRNAIWFGTDTNYLGRADLP
jgi:virginiamycin B lyase